MSIKAGLMGIHVSQFARECEREAEAETLELKDIFFRVLRNIGLSNPGTLEAWLDGEGTDTEQ